MHTCGYFSLQSKDNTFRGHTDSVDQLCWHPSNFDLLVTASGDKTVRLWDARSRKPVSTIATKGTTSLLFSRQIVSCYALLLMLLLLLLLLLMTCTPERSSKLITPYQHDDFTLRCTSTRMSMGKLCCPKMSILACSNAGHSSSQRFVSAMQNCKFWMT